MDSVFSNSDSDILNHLGSATLRCPQKCSRMLKSRTDFELCFELLLSLFTFSLSWLTTWHFHPEYVFWYLMSLSTLFVQRTALPVSQAPTNLKVEWLLASGFHYTLVCFYSHISLQIAVKCKIFLWLLFLLDSDSIVVKMSYQDVVFYTKCFVIKLCMMFAARSCLDFHISPIS